jgi:hypothetical protein
LVDQLLGFGDRCASTGVVITECFDRFEFPSLLAEVGVSLIAKSLKKDSLDVVARVSGSAERCTLLEIDLFEDLGTLCRLYRITGDNTRSDASSERSEPEPDSGTDQPADGAGRDQCDSNPTSDGATGEASSSCDGSGCTSNRRPACATLPDCHTESAASTSLDRPCSTSTEIDPPLDSV